LADWQLFKPLQHSFLNPRKSLAMDDPVDLDVDDDRALRRFHGPRSGDDAKSVRVLLFGEALFRER